MFLKKQIIKKGHCTVFVFSQILNNTKTAISHILEWRQFFVKQSVQQGSYLDVTVTPHDGRWR